MARKKRVLAALAGKKRAPIQRERNFQRELLTFYIQGCGHHHSVLFAVPNGELRDKATAGMLSGISGERRAMLPEIDRLMPCGLGVVPGVSDLILLTAPPTKIKRLADRLLRWCGVRVFLGQVTFIELKAGADVMRELKAGRQNDEQKIFERAARRLGHDYRLINNLQDFYDLLMEKGVPFRLGRPLTPIYAAPLRPAAPDPRPAPLTPARPRRRSPVAA
jgi:hypothetical protein